MCAADLEMKISDIAKIIGGRLACGSSGISVTAGAISTDSRTIKRRGLFIALKGENFDGTRFVEDAFRRGAAAAIASSSLRCLECYERPIVVVSDTTRALQDLARHNRLRFRTPVICITGSNGKTTTKEMTAKLLGVRYNVLKNEGNKNNQIGIPQTLLKLGAGHGMCVLEFGARHPGDITTLSDIAAPDAAVVTNIGPSHLETFGSLRGVYRTKMEIVSSLKRGAPLFLNGDDGFLAGVKGGKFKVVRFGLGESNDFRATSVVTEKDRIHFALNGGMDFELRLLGTHNVYNALAAIAVASYFGMDLKTIRRSLSAYRPSGMRLNLKRIGGFYIIDDSYNSNPLSMASALDTLKAYPARARWIVSGDMLELGRRQEFFHRMIGSLAAKMNVEGLFTLGRLSRHTHAEAIKRGLPRSRVRHCSCHDEIVSLIRSSARDGDVVLVKGSRGMAMETVIRKL
jgi:UDP-N-acetylmuramoyl-tripeptide--D-alanyl-D-alanine ligase